MTSSRAKSDFWRGVRDSAPFALVVAPFAMVFGVIATEAGLNVAQVMGFSILVIAGASQLAALQLMSENAPTVIVLLTALAVNLRMAMYSAALTPWLGPAPFWQRAVVAYFNIDQTYAVSVARYEAHPQTSVPQRIRYFFGTVAPIAPVWYAMTLVGALVGAAIPPAFGLDFVVPIAFLALVAPMLRTLAHLGAAATSILGALALAWMPYGTGLLLAAAVAMMVGAAIEQRMARIRPA